MLEELILNKQFPGYTNLLCIQLFLCQLVPSRYV